MYACKSKRQKKLFLKETPVYEGVKGGYHHCFSWGGTERGGGGKIDIIYEVEAKHQSISFALLTKMLALMDRSRNV